jgi:hypothetical protein
MFSNIYLTGSGIPTAGFEGLYEYSLVSDISWTFDRTPITVSFGIYFDAGDNNVNGVGSGLLTTGL